MSEEIEKWLDMMLPTMKRDDPLPPKFPTRIPFPNEVYILCRFSSMLTDHMTPYDIYAVYPSKELLERNFPDLEFNWDVRATSQYVVGVAGKPDAESSEYFILARSMVTEAK